MLPEFALSDIARRLDAEPLRPMHVATALVAALGLFIDIAELALNAVFSTSFPDKMAFVPVSAQSVLLGSVFAGGIIGAPLFGLVADRYGRRRAMLASMAIVSVFSIAAALVQNVWLLIAFRFLSGIALGAYPPLMTAWLTDILPPRWRGRIILWGDALGFLGAPALVFVIYHLVGAGAPAQTGSFEAWRIALAGLAVIAVACGLGFALLPESPRWLAARGRQKEAEEALATFQKARISLRRPTTRRRQEPSPAAALATSREAHVAAAVPPSDAIASPPSAVRLGEIRQRVALILVLYALRAVPTVVFPVMMGLVLRKKGIDFNTSLLLVAASTFGGTLGTLCASAIIEHVERRVALCVCGGLLVLSGVAFAAADTAELLLVSASAFLTLGAIFGPVLSIYAAEILPTSIRASATATGWGLTRLMSSILPVALLPILAGAGPWAFMSFVLAAIVLSLLAIAGFGPRQPPRRSIV